MEHPAKRRRSRLPVRLVLAGLVLSTSMGHGDGCCSDPALFGPPTMSTCPPASNLTFDNFGRQFMEDYCVRCHASTLTGADRHGAPSFHDFDTVLGIRAVANHIDETTASGPGATNTSMPPGGAKPTVEERRLLGEWIACGMP